MNWTSVSVSHLGQRRQLLSMVIAVHISRPYRFISICLLVYHHGESVALLVARRTNNWKVLGSMPANVVCITVLTGNRLG